MLLKVLLPAFVLIYINATAMAQNKKEMLLQELYISSGMQKQNEQLPLIIQAGFDQAAAADDRLNEMPRSVFGEIRDSIKTVFSAKQIKTIVLQECREKLSVEDLEKILGWLNSSLGRKLTQAEELATTPEKIQEMQRYALHLQKSPPPPDRLKIIQLFDSIVKATKTNVEIAMNTQIAVTIAVIASLPHEKQPPYENIVTAIEQNRSQIESAMRNQTIVSLLFIYNDITNEELNEYISFASSSAGNNYHDSAISGLKKALLSGGYKWGENIADILKQSKGKTEV